MKRRVLGFFSAVFLSMFFSVSIEVIQLIFMVGIFDVDDILMNTAGGLIGYLFFILGNRITGSLHKKETKGEKNEATKVTKKK
jgi:glycopeptide antibiotics resistance protein